MMKKGVLMRTTKGVALAISLALTMVATVVEAASLGPISEETPPAVCDPGHFIEEVRCTGGYCDNMRISCRRLPDAALGQASWKPWVSEEHGGRTDCGNRSFIAGFACRGGYCDNVSLYCVGVTNVTVIGACQEVGPVSEERGGKLNFFGAMMGDKAGQLFFARGMRCSGRYCDNKYFTVCEVSSSR